MKNTTIQLTKEWMKSLTHVAHSIGQPKTVIIRNAIEAYLEEYRDYQIALNRLRNKKDKVISRGELKL